MRVGVRVRERVRGLEGQRVMGLGLGLGMGLGLGLGSVSGLGLGLSLGLAKVWQRFGFG